MRSLRRKLMYPVGTRDRLQEVWRPPQAERQAPYSLGFRVMELGGLEPPTSWVRSRDAQLHTGVDLLDVCPDSALLMGLVSGSVCRGLSGLWSALRPARTSGGAALVVAPRSSEPDRSGEVTLKG